MTATNHAPCAARCGQLVDLAELHYTVICNLERVEGGEICPTEGADMAYAHLGCWPGGTVIVTATPGMPGDGALAAFQAVAS